MAFDKWTVLCSVLFLFVSSIGNINAQGCGGIYTANYDVFTSANYPNTYDLNSECTYTISLSTNSSITLSFETFDMDRIGRDNVSITCESNSSFVEQRYNTWYNHIAPISIPWCSSVQLYFLSDSTQLYPTRGFRVQYQVNTIGCGNTVFEAYGESSGNFSSPNYPQNYNNDENCTYSIWALTLSSFTLSFEAFQLESDCERDWVQIRCDNSTYISPKYCGSTLPKPAYIRNCKKVLIWFHTDYSAVYSGFKLQYSVAPNGCGKSYYGGLSGIITSPSYPKGDNSISCSYLMYPVSSVAFAYQSFDLEPFVDTSDGDYVLIDCYNNSSVDTRYYRGNTLPPLISYTLCRSVSINFYCNPVLSGTGFNIQYEVNPLVAHSVITTAPQNFTVVVGSQVQLDCTSDAKDYYPSWTLSTDGTDENTATIASFCIVNPGYTPQYNVVSDGPGVCSLVITSATLAEAGIYTCIDVGLASIISVVSVVDSTTASKLSDQALHDDNQK